MKFLLSLVLLPFLLPFDSYACTTFCLKNKSEVLFGKNYDWMIGDGLIFVNKRGVSKTSSEDGNPAKWISKYGSVSFNQYGWESPSGGINEAGLVIELMWLDDTQYPKADERPAVDVLEWIQYNLDTASTTDEVIRNADALRIVSAVKLHYLVNDKDGHSATIEYLDGKLVVHSGIGLPVASLANDTYARSLQYVGGKAQGLTESSLDRFSRAAARTSKFGNKPLAQKEAVDYAFETLANVAQKSSTQWSIVYDQKRGRVYFRTRTQPGLKSIDTTAFDYSCATAVKILDVNTAEDGDVTHFFKPYSRTDNRDLIQRAFEGTPFLKNIPASTRDSFARFPDQFTCSAHAPVTKPLDPKSQIASGALVSYLIFGVPLYYVYESVSS